MPDLLIVFSKRWKWILTITLAATIIALVFALLSPKKYLAVATALPVNSLVADRARMFNQNVQELYSEFGLPDELDRLEGTAALDTIFIAASEAFNLDDHYSIKKSSESFYNAVVRLKKNSKIKRSSYGELKVRVWDKDRNMAAALSNFLMEQIQTIHQRLQNQSNVSVLQKIKQEYASKQKEYLQLGQSFTNTIADTASVNFAAANKDLAKTRMMVLSEQLKQYQKMIGEYELAISANTPVLLVVENARPPIWADKPKVLQTVLFTFFGAFFFSFLLALFLERRKHSV
jgi:uncharacterized protein involved in exopolysaccharide biosynthesis